MEQTEKSPKTIIVAGDVTIDWNIARHEDYQGSGLVWNAEDYIRTYSRPGGAALLADLIDEIAQRMNRQSPEQFEVKGVVKEGSIIPDDERYHHSYALWSLSKYDESEPQHKNVRVWRVKNHLGLYTSKNTGATTKELWNRFVKDIPGSTLIVIDDANMGFREASGIWAEGLNFPDAKQQKPWIILKMARPIADGGLWKHLLSKGLADRLIVVTPVNDVRVKNSQVSRELSWERTAQELLWELENNSNLAGLSQCAHVVISFGPAGAMLLSSSDSKKESPEKSEAPKPTPTPTLFFDPKVIEEMWGQQHPGGVVGYTSCLVASLAHQIMVSEKSPSIAQGIRNGLKAMRTLHIEGYGRQDNVEKITLQNLTELEFPFSKIATELTGIEAKKESDSESDAGKSKAAAVENKSPFSDVQVKDSTRSLTLPPAGLAREDNFWTILRDKHEDLHKLASEIVKQGAKRALKDVPLGEFADLLTADRREIEGYRSISALVREYSSQLNPQRPLSIAVFGPPGSGKSFGISEVAKEIIKGGEKLEFNLSQFSDPQELVSALHQVRDKALKGSIPLVFWDEFDTALNGQPLGWLRYFLAPMQDGKFQSGQITHSVGHAIFVFAGGTSGSRKEFEQNIKSDKLKDVKGPDFISRLKGFIDIMGPDPNTEADDPTHIVRRAILLRSLFERKSPNLFKWSDKKGELRIDDGVLYAFLKISRYKHGVRSMESIVDMSQLAKKSRFDRSSLPTEAQLDLHVNGGAFRSLVQQVELNEEIAKVIHERFVEELRQKGYTWGEKTDDVKKTHSSMKPFEELPEHEKEQNRGQAQEIPDKLSRIGYHMIPNVNNEPPFEFSFKEQELLAEIEHERWLKEKLKRKASEKEWSYGPKTDKDDKIRKHQDMLPWRKLSKDEQRRKFSEDEIARLGTGVLSETAKQKDRDAVKAIPEILAKIGYTIVKAQDKSEKDKEANPVSKPVVRIGVKGLRNLAATDKIKSSVIAAIDWIERAFPDHQLAAVSTMMEGAEMLVVKHILERAGAQSIVVLPLPENEYENEFKTLESRQGFHTFLEQADDVYRVPADLARVEAYRAASDYLLEHSDVLIAICDWQQPETVDETTEIIAKARTRDLPIALISAASEDAKADDPARLRAKPGNVTFENF